MSSEPDRFLVGKIVGVHGLRGTLKIRPNTNSPELLLDMETMDLEIAPSVYELVHIHSCKLEKGNLYVGVDECEDRTSAEELVGRSVYTERTQLAELEEDEWWIDDLVGLDVYTISGAHVGTVSDVLGAAGQLLEVRRLGGGEDDTALVPFVKALVPTVDLKARRIEIADLPGLIDP